MNNELKIAICVATYKRPVLLRNCLQSIDELVLPSLNEIVIIVVDNDKQQSAKDVALEFINATSHEAYYYVEPVRGIASARNRLVQEAVRLGANLIGFIDDDEFPHKEWLSNHLKALKQHHADVAAGPVAPITGTTPVDSIKPNKKMPTGCEPRHVAAGNVIFDSSLITEKHLAFDVAYNFSGGEDFDFFDRSRAMGNKHIWVDSAVIYETVIPARTTRRYLFFRHFTGAINNVMQYKKRHNIINVWFHFIIKAIGKFFGSALSFIFFILSFNNKNLEKSIIKFASATGYISGSLNIIVERYR